MGIVAAMIELRPLGRTGVKVSALCLGAMNFGGPADEAESEKMLLAALDAGINFIDTADVYTGGNSERIVGEVLERAGKRDDIVLATKVGIPSGPGPNNQGASRRHIVRSCEASLTRLRTDRIDLYQLHRPLFDIDPEETLGAFDDLVRAGKVINIGCSTHPAWFVHECLAVSDKRGWARYVSEQPPYNLLDRRVENELVPLALRHGLALLPWSPLGGGILAGRYRSTTKPPAGIARGPHARRAGSSDEGRSGRRQGGRRSWPTSAGSRRDSSRCCGCAIARASRARSSGRARSSTCRSRWRSPTTRRSTTRPSPPSTPSSRPARSSATSTTPAAGWPAPARSSTPKPFSHSNRHSSVSF